jgi:hypothetical protein
VLHEIAQQFELAGGELDADLAPARLVQLEVDVDVADPDRVGGGRSLRAGAVRSTARTRASSSVIEKGLVT